MAWFNIHHWNWSFSKVLFHMRPWQTIRSTIDLDGHYLKMVRCCSWIITIYRTCITWAGLHLLGLLLIKAGSEIIWFFPCSYAAIGWTNLLASGSLSNYTLTEQSFSKNCQTFLSDVCHYNMHCKFDCDSKWTL